MDHTVTAVLWETVCVSDPDVYAGRLDLSGLKGIDGEEAGRKVPLNSFIRQDHAISPITS